MHPSSADPPPKLAAWRPLFVGIKMLLIEWYKIPIGISLGAIAGILTVSIVASLLATRRDERRGGEISESVSRTPSENPGV